MKIAIVHDWLNQKVGGAESVLFELSRMYPDADIFTLIYSPEHFDRYLANRKVTTSILNSLPRFIRSRPQLLLPFIKRAVTRWDFAGYDVVISSSTAWVKNISLPKGVKHISYCHSPARMLWDSWPKYLDKFQLGPMRKYFVTKLASGLRLWDYYQSQNGTKFIANSHYVADRISKFYHQPSVVIYPPVNLIETTKNSNQKKDFYLIISVLSQYKNIELAIRAFRINGRELVIAGDGPNAENLKKMAQGVGNIRFTGRVDDDYKQQLYLQARAFIFCSIEDFGITMVESISANTPVLALRGGGAEEIIKENKTGAFFDQPDEQALNRCIDQFEQTFNHATKLNNRYIQKFETQHFVSSIQAEVERV